MGTATFGRGSSTNNPVDTSGTGGGGTVPVDTAIYSTTGKHVTATASGIGSGTYASPWTMAQALANAAPGDSVYVHPGTYSTPFTPSQSGTSGARIVYRAWGTGVCSVYVAGSSAFPFQNVDYITVHGLRFQTGWYNGDKALDVQNASHFLFIRCGFYGGTYRTGSGGTYTSFAFINAHYGRVLRCFFDRQDPVLPEADQGDGIAWYESSHNIFEYDTVTNVAHAAWYGPGTRSGSTPPWVEMSGVTVMRHCVAYNAHNCYDLQNNGNTILMEGCKAWSPMTKNTDKGGHALEIAIQRSIIRYCNFFNDSTRTQSSGGMNNAVSAFIGMSNMGYAVLRVYNNNFLGSPYGNPLPAWSLFLSDEGYTTVPLGRNVFANNIIANLSGARACDSSVYHYRDRRVTYTNVQDTMKGNAIYNGKPTEPDIDFLTSGEDYTNSLAAVKSHAPTFMQSSNIGNAPKWVDSTSLRGARNFQLATDSPLKNAGVFLTVMRGNASSTTILDVADSKYFWYPHSNPYDKGDSIAVWHSGAWTNCLVDSVDTLNNRVIVHTAVTLTAGDGITVLSTYNTTYNAYIRRLYGTMPDIGSYELP